jgi:hypothetical protein
VPARKQPSAKAHAREIVESDERVGMFLAQEMLPSRKRALKERFCFRVAGLGLVDRGQIAYGDKGMRILIPEQPLVCLECALVKGLGLIVAVRCEVKPGEIADAGKGLRMILAQHALPSLKRPLK